MSFDGMCDFRADRGVPLREVHPEHQLKPLKAVQDRRKVLGFEGERSVRLGVQSRTGVNIKVELLVRERVVDCAHVQDVRRMVTEQP